MACLDTDFLIDLKDQGESALKKMEELYSKGEEVFTTAVNLAEFYFGVYRMKNKEAALTVADEFLRPFFVLNLDRASARLYGELAEKIRTKMIGDADLFIASIALANKQTLITRNKKHFERVPGLQVEGW